MIAARLRAVDRITVVGAVAFLFGLGDILIAATIGPIPRWFVLMLASAAAIWPILWASLVRQAAFWERMAERWQEAAERWMALAGGGAEPPAGD